MNMQPLRSLLVGMILFWTHAGMCSVQAREDINLDGVWEFATDPDDRGEADRWFAPGAVFPQMPLPGYAPAANGTIQVPGCWEAQGYGKEGVLSHIRRVYMGKGWYRRRQVTVPTAWQGKRVWLAIGGVHRFVDAWVNGVSVGSHDGFATAARLDITKAIRCGAPNTIALCVDNRGRPGNDMKGCFNYYHPWGGFYRGISLEATSPTHIANVGVEPDMDCSRAVFRVRITGDRGETGNLSLRVEGQGIGFDQTFASSASEPVKNLDQEYVLKASVPQPRLWSPETPNLYSAAIVLSDTFGPIDRLVVRFGMRKLEARDGKVLLNGKAVFLCGVGEDAMNPLTGFPPASKDAYLARFRQLKDMGFVYVRYHSWCPPPECFEAADELGMLLHPELQIAYARHRDSNSEILIKEWRRLLIQCRNHPSLLWFSMGNEANDALETDFYKRLFAVARELAPKLLVLDTDCWDFFKPGRHTSAFTDGQGWFVCREGKDYSHLPHMSHEMGNFNALEDLRDIEKYRGPVVPVWITRRKEQLESTGLMPHYERWLQRSMRLQQDCRKWVIEEARSRPYLDGFTYWMATNYDEISSGVNCETCGANIGILDNFWEAKENVDFREFRNINGETVLLARLPSHNFVLGRTRRIPVLISHYGDSPISNPRATWRLTEGNRILAQGDVSHAASSVPCGSVVELGTIEIASFDVDRPTKANLRIEMPHANLVLENSWPVWLFPASVELPSGLKPIFVGGKLAPLAKAFPQAETSREPRGPVVVCQGSLPPGSVDYLRSGGRILYLNPTENAITRCVHDFAPAFFPGWWSRKNNLGVSISPHPVFEGLNHDGYCDFGFREMINLSGKKLDLSGLDPKLEPIVWAIPDRTGYLFEIGVGKGRMLVTSFNVTAGITGKDIPRQMSEYAPIGEFDLTAGIDGEEPWSRYLFVRMVAYLARVDLPQAPSVDPAKFIETPCLPEGPYISGFRSVIQKGETGNWYSHREDHAQNYVCRQTDATNVVSWETALVPSKPESELVTFVFVGGLGHATQPKGAGFAVFVNGKNVLEFNVATQSTVWYGRDREERLYFQKLREVSDGQDHLGLFYLQVSRGRLQAGRPCCLEVRSQGSGSRRWFAIYPYTEPLGEK